MKPAAGAKRSAGLRPGKSPLGAPAAVISLPPEFFAAVRHHKRRLTHDVLLVSTACQRMWHFRWDSNQPLTRPPATLSPSDGERDGVRGELSTTLYHLQKQFVISTSRFGIGQIEGSNKTPLGLHRIARKIGGGQPVGTVFKGRKPIGTITQIGKDKAMICHRILWLDGLEPGFNRGGNVDTFTRYIYLHGFGDETTLGHPQSHGCIHVGASDLLPLFDAVPRGTLVWISRD
jgi:hypothetical protein